MLHFEAVAAETLDLLKAIQAIDEFSDLRLVGGTSLALQFSHRLSVDLNFFGALSLEDEELLGKLSKLGPTRPVKLSKLIKTLFCRNIKIDFVKFDYPWISPPILANSLILAGDKDIAAMKISAITGRGSKKDFYDVFELLKRYTLKNIMEWYSLKYIDGSQYLALKSLIYFEDAEEQEDPISLNGTTWEQVKTSILKVHAEYLKGL